MPKYEVEIEVPQTGDVGHLIERLREQAHPKLVIRIEASSRRQAAAALGESVSGWWYGERFTKDWWLSRLRAIRGKRAKIDFFDKEWY